MSPLIVRSIPNKTGRRWVGNVFSQQTGLWKLKLWTVGANAVFLSYQSQFHGFHYFRGLLSFSALNVMFDMWGRRTWEDGVWRENRWAGFLAARAGMRQPGLPSGRGGPGRKAQAQGSRYNKVSWLFWSNICWEWAKFLLLLSPSHKGSVLWSLCLNASGLRFVVPFRPVPHPLFFPQLCVA